MDYTELLNWLANVDWVREVIGCIAIGCGMIGKWRLGDMKVSGWVWSLVGSFFWLLFAYRIDSPTGLFNNALYIYLSIRGYRAWENARQVRENLQIQDSSSLSK